MLSILAKKSGQGRYYTELTAEAYYLEGGEPPGVWLGEGARRLGLQGEADKDLFSSLYEGLTPEGRKLVQNAGAGDRKCGWDLTFSAPKSVSVLWSQLGGEYGHEIRASHAQAVEAAMAYLEETAGFTRRGKGGAVKEKADLICCAFEHGTSRALDPQLHTHVLVLNIGVRRDGTTGSLTSPEFYDHKMAAGAIYRAELARNLKQRLGLEIRKEKTWFEIEGVSRKLIEVFSKRRMAITEKLAELELAGPKASEMAALSTRSAKDCVPRSELFGGWGKTGTENGFGKEEAQRLIREGRIYPDADLKRVQQERIVGEALGEITRKDAYFPERELVRRTAEHAVEHGLSAKECLSAARAHLHSEQSVRLAEDSGYMQYTTREMCRLETSMLECVQRLAERRGPVGTLQPWQGEKLNEEQRSAVSHITEAPGSLKAVSGMAGTGKTTMLQAAREVWSEAGLKVWGAVIFAKAARGLQEEAGIASSTVAKLLIKLDKLETEGRKAPDVLVVDEAGLVDTRHMARVLAHCDSKRIKLVIVGDERQIQPIEAGGPFYSITGRMGAVELKTIIRQKEDWAKEAVHAMADGHALSAMEEFARRGRLTITDTREEARSALVAEWRKNGLEKPENHLILAATNADIAILNRQIQAMRKNQGYLWGESVRNPDNGNNFYEADRVRFKRNSPAHGVENGTLGTVTGVFPGLLGGPGSLHVQLDNSGKTVAVSFRNYTDVVLGYAATTHCAQGMTATNAYVLTDPSMQDKHLSYVQFSRAREQTKVFAARMELDTEHRSELEALSKTMSRDRTKRLALDLLPGADRRGIEPEPVLRPLPGERVGGLRPNLDTGNRLQISP